MFAFVTIVALGIIRGAIVANGHVASPRVFDSLCIVARYLGLAFLAPCIPLVIAGIAIDAFPIFRAKIIVFPESASASFARIGFIRDAIFRFRAILARVRDFDIFGVVIRDSVVNIEIRQDESAGVFNPSNFRTFKASSVRVAVRV
jgi:hypothetical protein